MTFNELKQGIQTLSDSFRQNAALAVNTHLTIRNWLIGFHIVEFEQNGEDRAGYGARLLQNLADGFNEDGLSYRNLKLYRQFYTAYPRVKTFIPPFIQKYFGSIGQTPIAQLQLPDNGSNEIGQTVSAQLSRQEEPKSIPVKKLLGRLSFSHLTLLLPIEDPLKRLFYEIESIKGTWSVRELKRQINSLYYERSGMSRNPTLLSGIVQDNSEAGNMLDTIKSPFAFEFLGLKS